MIHNILCMQNYFRGYKKVRSRSYALKKQLLLSPSKLEMQKVYAFTFCTLLYPQSDSRLHRRFFPAQNCHIS